MTNFTPISLLSPMRDVRPFKQEVSPNRRDHNGSPNAVGHPVVMPANRHDVINTHSSPSPLPKKFPPLLEIAGRFITAGLITGGATTYAAWSNQCKLNPGLNPPLGQVFRSAIVGQSAMKGAQLGVYIGLQNVFVNTFPDHKRLATAMAYCTAATSSQAFIYTMATRVILRVSGRNVPPIKAADIMGNLKVALKPTFVREFGSTASAIAITPDVEGMLGRILPEETAKVLGAPLAGMLCGLATQGIHNIALTESRHFAEGKQPSTLVAAKEVFSVHGIHALYRGFFPARCVLIMVGTVVGSKLLGPMKAD